MFLALLASDVWVARDAKRLGAKRGTLGGFLDMGPVGWFFVCLFLWIVAFPCYLVTRPKLVAAKAAREGYPPQSYPSYPPPFPTKCPVLRQLWNCLAEFLLWAVRSACPHR